VIGRRSFLIGLAAGIAAPAIVRPASIMRVNALLTPDILTIGLPPYPECQVWSIIDETFKNAARKYFDIEAYLQFKNTRVIYSLATDPARS
jgi:hypothetical protein